MGTAHAGLCRETFPTYNPPTFFDVKKWKTEGCDVSAGKALSDWCPSPGRAPDPRVVEKSEDWKAKEKVAF